MPGPAGAILPGPHPRKRIARLGLQSYGHSSRRMLRRAGRTAIAEILT